MYKYNNINNGNHKEMMVKGSDIPVCHLHDARQIRTEIRENIVQLLTTGHAASK